MTRTLKVGDLVRTPDHHSGPITAIRRGQWEDRSGRKWRHNWYEVKSPRPGSPTEWWLAFQLKRVQR